VLRRRLLPLESERAPERHKWNISVSAIPTSLADMIVGSGSGEVVGILIMAYCGFGTGITNDHPLIVRTL